LVNPVYIVVEVCRGSVDRATCRACDFLIGH
jgi:hypothetical protein